MIYRAHSELLQTNRYKHLVHQDYTTWAKGLSAAGYATAVQSEIIGVDRNLGVTSV